MLRSETHHASKAPFGSALLAGVVLLAFHDFASAASSAAGSPLADAVMQQDDAQVRTLLGHHADVNAAQPDGSTALHWAASRSEAETTARLLAAGARPNVTTDTGMTPLVLACQAGSLGVVKLLLEHGADVNQTLLHGETPLMMAARTGSVPVLQLLLLHGAQVEAREKLRGTTALMWAASSSNVQAVKFLISKGADISARSGKTAAGRRPYLAETGRSRISQFAYGYGLAGEFVAKDEAQAKEHEREQGVSKGVLERYPLQKLPTASAEQWGGLTPLIFAAREGNMATVKALVEAGADVNETSSYDWTPLLVATQNKYYQIGKYLLEHGANPNTMNGGCWTPLYIATDNRNIEAGDYPVRKPDMDHLDFIKLLLNASADPNLRMCSSTETRTVFTNQWLDESGATAFLRAAQSGDLVLMKLLLAHGADPHIPTYINVTPLMVASGIGWVEGVTYEWSAKQTYETVKFLLDDGADANAQDRVDRRTALMGAAHKGRDDVIQLLIDHGADLSLHDIGSRDTVHALAGVSWQAIDYADGLVRVGVQSAIPHPETSAFLRKLMKERGLTVPPEGRTLASICITPICQPAQAH
jgi:uncharacterized protein